MARNSKARRRPSALPSAAAGLRSTGAVGIKDIALRLGTSIGTVDRALNGKPGINADTCARVLAEARSLGYRPNLAARYLRSRKNVRISVHLPTSRSLFWDALREGIREAAAPLAPSLAVEFLPCVDADGEPVLHTASTDYRHGLIIAQGHHPALAARVEEAARRNLAVACVADDVPDPRFISVSADPFSVGALAGELVGRFVSRGADVALVADSLTTAAHTVRVRGFASTLTSVSPRSTLAATIESHPDAGETHRRIRALLHAHPRLQGICVTSADALAVLHALEAERGRGDVEVVVTDLAPELFEPIRAGRIAAAIYQRPLAQGRLAVQLLYQCLQEGAGRAATRRIVAPYAVMRSNLDLVLERLEIARTTSSAQEGIQ
jgi:LacI family transcriptional regulator